MVKSTKKESITWIAVLLFLLPWGMVPCQAQNIASSTLVWAVEDSVSTQTQTTKAYQASFRTRRAKTVEWTQKRGQITKKYTVISTEGEWKDVSKVGQFTYVLERNNRKVRMTIERVESGTFITLEFPLENGEQFRQRFHVHSFQIID